MVSSVSVEVDARTNVVLRRYVQYVLDRLLLFVLAALVFFALLEVAILLAQLGVRASAWMIYVILGISAITAVGGTAYFEIWYTREYGGMTPAMRWLGLRIVTVEGGEPALKAYFLRWLMLVVDGMFLGLLGAVLIAVTSRHQRLGDMVARTLVIRCPPAARDRGEVRPTLRRNRAARLHGRRG